MLVCWSVGGGVGTSVVVAGLALAAARHDEASLVVDLGGDQPTLFGVPEPDTPGLAGWLRAGAEVPPDALRRLEADLVPGIALLPRGGGDLGAQRAGALGCGLADDDRFVVVDAGCVAAGSAAEGLVLGADRTLLVTRACPVALRRLAHLPVRPEGVVVVRDRRRSVAWHEIAEVSGAPVLAELDVDPAIGVAVDAGLANRPLPRTFLRVLGGLR